MSVNAKFVADFTTFDAGVAGAELKLRSFDASLGRVDKDLAKFGNQFSGTKIIQDARLMDEAIQRIGGTSKLTEAELRRVGGTAKEAVDKMKALGMDVPERLENLAKHAKTSNTELFSMQGVVGKLGPALAATFTVGGVVAFAKGVGEFAGQMKDLSVETGVGVERLQAFTYVGAGAGVTAEDFARSAFNVSKRIAGGDESADAALRKLNLSIGQFKGLKPDETLLRIADAFKQVTDQNEKALIANDLFGKSGTKMLRLFEGDLRSMISEVEHSGAVIQEELIDKADQFDDAWTQAIMRVKAELVNMLGAVPSATDKAISSIGSPQGAAGGAGSRLMNLANSIYYSDQNTAAARAAEEALRNRQSPGIPSAALPKVSIPAELKEIEARLTREAQENAAAAIKAAAALKAMNREIFDAQTSAIEAGLVFANLDVALTNAAVAAQTSAIEGGHAFDAYFDKLNKELRDAQDSAISGGLAFNENSDWGRWSAFAAGPQENEMLPGAWARGRQPDTKPGMWAGIGKSIGAELGPTLMAAITGGGSKLQAAGSVVGVGITKTLSDNFGKSIAGAFGSSGIGKFVGDTIGSFLPGIGALVGPALGKLVGIFGGEGRKTNDVRDATFDKAGGFENVAKMAAEAGASMDRVLKADKVKTFEAAWKDLTAQIQTHNDKLAETEAQLAQLGDAQKQRQDMVNEAIGRYKFSIEELGPALSNQKLAEQAEQMLTDWKLLTEAGINTNAVLRELGPSMQDFISSARKTGTEVPESMRAMIEEMLEAGLLTDENGEKFKDLESVGIKFGRTLEDMFEGVLEKLDRLIEKLSAAKDGFADVGSAKVPDVSYTGVPDLGATHPWATDMPGFATGTQGRYLNFSSGTPVMLHGRERVMTEAEGAAEASGLAALSGQVAALNGTMAALIQGLPAQIEAAVVVGRARFA